MRAALVPVPRMTIPRVTLPTVTRSAYTRSKSTDLERCQFESQKPKASPVGTLEETSRTRQISLVTGAAGARTSLAVPRHDARAECSIDYQDSPKGRSSTLNDQLERGWCATCQIVSAMSLG